MLTYHTNTLCESFSNFEEGQPTYPVKKFSFGKKIINHGKSSKFMENRKIQEKLKIKKKLQKIEKNHGKLEKIHGKLEKIHGKSKTVKENRKKARKSEKNHGKLKTIHGKSKKIMENRKKKFLGCAFFSGKIVNFLNSGIFYGGMVTVVLKHQSSRYV